MKLGLVLGAGSAANDIALARRAESAGFNSVYSYDFFASNALVRLGGIAIACTPDEFRDRLQQWSDITGEPLLFPATVGVAPERVAANIDAIVEAASAHVS